MSQHREEHLDLCAAYALGSLDEADRRLLEAHLEQGCAQCEAALADFSAATVLLAASAPAARPSAELKRRVMAAVRSDGPEAAPAPEGRRLVLERPRRAMLSWAWAAVAAALVIATAISWNTASRLRTELEAKRSQMTELEQRLADEQRWAAVLSAPQARVVELATTPQGTPDLKARVTYDPATQRAVVVFENFRAPTGHDYELWAIRGATPAPASLGLVKADDTGHAVLRLENVGDPATLGAFAVSLEPAGGSPNPAAPSGPVVMLGKVSG
ncbi:MAG TPA: anti-sigma factor [Candidatus Limnocylindria bacterium]|nr:anti-sigma factor [Candidatus Limnocylindria bacterium]